ncbi:MAG TPA: 1-acyl-sn-glycerol-3-phosphate acyltransferase, partial [Planctomycetota bacterium]|nr:1-acyl-sn-glycerol-3-phosphate acyltransferase [Planctomycetota bacterium]
AAALLPWPGRALDPRAVAAAANAKLEEGRGVARAFVWPGEDFPRTPTMKVRKFQVRDAIAAGGATDAAVAGASGDDPLLALLSKQVRRPPGEIEGTHRLGADLGLDSLDLVDLVSSAEELFRMDIDEGEVGPATTVDQLRALVKARKPVDDAGLPAWPRTWWGEAGRRLFRGLVLFPLFRFFARDEVSGLEHLPPAGTPVIYAPNHLSHLDTPAILDALPPALRRRTGAAAWKEYWEPPGAGVFKRAFLASLRTLLLMVLPLVPIAQTKGWRRSLRGVGTMLDAGWSLIFFPEGERSRSGVRLPFRAGIGVVAGAMRAPVVPVFVDGFHSILPRDAFWPRRGGGRVIFGKPLSFPADADPEQVARAVEKAVDALGVVPGAAAAATGGPPPPRAGP